MPALRCLSEIAGLLVPRGPFFQGVVADGEFVFVAGQGPSNPAEDKFVRGSIGEQTRLTLACVDRILRAAGTRRERVVSCRGYLQALDPETLAAINAVYAEFFGSHKPARPTIGASSWGLTWRSTASRC